MRTDPSRLRVLVVDDCRDTTHSYILLLKTWGREALGGCQAAGTTP
jgi:hypothetical protein